VTVSPSCDAQKEGLAEKVRNQAQQIEDLEKNNEELKNRIRLLEADLEAAEDKNDDYSAYVELS